MFSREAISIRHVLIRGLLCAMAALVTTSCTTLGGQASALPVSEKAFAGDPAQPKDIFVFLDGTKNDAASDTNVRRMFEAVYQANDPQSTALYIEGVGAAETPLLGMSLGYGMEPRILRGYDFISQSYRTGDRIRVFGFSRGAHSARALAGLIAYAGLPPRSENDFGARLKADNRVLEIVKQVNDEAYVQAWRAWQPGAAPPLSEAVRAKLNLNMIPAEVTFLGVWDTVPGSSFKKFGVCKELSDGRDGDRYKSDSYPPIRNIAHAVSLDEKRSMFSPILLCPALNSEMTIVDEVWFPGVHADVGGGYADSNDLSRLSFKWMVSKLAPNYQLAASFNQLQGNPLGLAHWSIGDRPANARSHCQDRIAPAGAILDPSVDLRRKADKVPIRMMGKVEQRPYPQSCPG